MSTIAFRGGIVRGLSAVRDNPSVLAIFSAALFLSALLLFSVQPIFAKMVLPKLGGASSVWAVSMVFFQAVLLGGYCYAHGLNRYCPSRYAPPVHLGLMTSAILALPFGLPAMAAEPPADGTYFWLIGVLGLGVGLPFFAVSANAPLLQSWFARSGHPHASDPYFLYGASNFGSLIALLAYPIAVEPVFGLSRQAIVWSGTFLVLGLLIAICGWLATRSSDALTAIAVPTKAASCNSPTRTKCLAWIGLSAIPSGLLVSFTSFLTTDIAAAPFLWVFPLAVFLGTFILVFRSRPMISQRTLLLLQPIMVGLTLLGLSMTGNKGWLIGVSAGFGAFFVTTLVCHKELYDRRPDSHHLTAFYMWMSLGGVLGGIFAALLAPQLFNGILEFPLLLLAGLAAHPRLASDCRDVAQRQLALVMMGALLVAGAVLAALIAFKAVPLGIVGGGGWLLVAACFIAILIMVDRPLPQIGCALVTLVGLFVLPSTMNRGFSERSFFGVHRIAMTTNDQIRTLMHGTTVHGAMRVRDIAGQPVETPLPSTYYYPGSPMARGVDAARVSSGKTDAGLVVGIIGLGTGSLSCYSRPNEVWRFYEIDPLVVKLARTPKLFSFLSRCRPAADIVMGDARLTLAKEKTQYFDYLVIDAFSSDSVPVHLLTTEAVRLYLSRLSEHGILALHISNRHLDLGGVAAAVANAIPGAVAALADDRPSSKTLDQSGSLVMFIAKSAKALEPVSAMPYVTPVGRNDTRAWTDDYSNVLGAILRKGND